MILGKRAPASLKIFLVTLLVLNDVCAILIMAIFYSGHLSAMSFMVAAAATLGLLALNLAGVNKKSLLRDFGHNPLGERAKIGRACDASGRRGGIFHTA